jgi:hypothetical protein
MEISVELSIMWKKVHILYIIYGENSTLTEKNRLIPTDNFQGNKKLFKIFAF